MKFEHAKLNEALDPQIVDAMKQIKNKISSDMKLKEYIDDYDPNTEPYAYVLSKGTRYSLHCHLRWSKVAKRASEVVKTKDYQSEMEDTVADKVSERILVNIIGGDYQEYRPKVKRNGVVIEVILTVPKDNTTEQPANLYNKEQDLTPPDNIS